MSGFLKQFRKYKNIRASQVFVLFPEAGVPVCVCVWRLLLFLCVALTVLKLWKRLMLCGGGGGVSMGNCRKGFMSR